MGFAYGTIDDMFNNVVVKSKKKVAKNQFKNSYPSVLTSFANLPCKFALQKCGTVTVGCGYQW